MRLVALSLVCLALVGVECALTRMLGLSIARADFEVAVVLFFAARCSTLEGAFGSATVGYFVDVLSGQPSGLYIVTAMLAYLFSKLMAPFVEIRSAKKFAVLAAGTDIAHNMAVWALSLISAAPGADRTPIILAIPWSAALTASAAFISWPLLKTVDGFFKKPETGLLRSFRER